MAREKRGARRRPPESNPSSPTEATEAAQDASERARPALPKRFRVVTAAILHDGVEYPIGAIVEPPPVMLRDASRFLEPVEDE